MAERKYTDYIVKAVKKGEPNDSVVELVRSARNIDSVSNYYKFQRRYDYVFVYELGEALSWDTIKERRDAEIAEYQAKKAQPAGPGPSPDAGEDEDWEI